MLTFVTSALATVSLSIILHSVAVAQVIEITQEKALAGGITPGDRRGFPITISKPGLYVFATDILPTANEGGIVITGFDGAATIDLSGFELHGQGAAVRGVYSTAAYNKGVSIKNGTITGFRSDGINVDIDYSVVDNVNVIKNGGIGIKLREFSRITNNTIVENDKGGILVSYGSHISGNNVSYNGRVGIQTDAATILNNTIFNNDGLGILGDRTGYGGNTIIDNAIINNMQVGGNVYPLRPNVCVNCP